MNLYYTLLKRNWKDKLTDTILTIAGITIAVAVMVFFVAMIIGLRQELLKQVSGTPLTQIEIRSLDNKLNPLTSQSKITQEKILQIQKIPHITGIIPSLQLATISSVEISFLGRAFQSDALIFGAPYDLVASSSINRNQWKNLTQEPYPAIASSRILDLYNLTVAGQNNLPAIKKEMLIGTNITIYPGKSSLSGKNSENIPPIKAKLVGFSNQVQLLGITLPEKIIADYNFKHFNIPKERSSFSTIQAAIDSPENYFQIKEDLEKINLTTHSYLESSSNQINNFFLIIGSVFSVIIITTLILSSLIVSLSTLSKIRTRYREIGLLRAMGATKKNIRNIFLIESGLIGLIAGFLSYILSFIFSILIDYIFINIIIPPTQSLTTLFNFNLPLFVFSVFFSILFCLLFSIIPAIKAANLNPIEAVNSNR